MVYDVTNPASFQHLQNWKNIFMTKSEPKEPHTLPFLVLGNKSDLEEGLKKVTTKEAQEFCSEDNIVFFETSAKDNLNIEEAFKAMAVKVIARQEGLNNKILGESAADPKKGGDAVANNANRRTARNTTKRVVLDDKNQPNQPQQQKSSCCGN